MPMSARRGAGRRDATTVAVSSSTASPPSASGTDLSAALRAAPQRSGGNSIERSGAQDGTQVNGGSTQAAPGAAPQPGQPGAAVKGPAATQSASPAASTQSTFGQTLAASLSSSASGPQRPAGPAGKVLKARASDSKSADPKVADTRAQDARPAAPQPGNGAAPMVAQAAPSTANADTTAASDAAPPTVLPAAARPIAQFASPEHLLEAPVTAATAGGAGAADEAPDTDSTDGTASPAGGFAAAIRAALPQAFAPALGASGDAQSGSAGSQQGSADPGDSGAALGAATATAAAPATTGTAAAAQQSGTPVTAQLHSAVGTSAWANELGARLHWMAGQGVSAASLRLTPEQLGPVEVKISMHENAASVFFSAAQPETRSALEAALPRLKELFSAQGLNLAQAGVSDQSARGARSHAPAPAAARALSAREEAVTSVTSAPRTHQGLIDTYA